MALRRLIVGKDHAGLFPTAARTDLFILPPWTVFQTRFITDPPRHAGITRTLMGVSRLTRKGCRAFICLREGTTDAYRWYRENRASARR